VSRVMWLSTMNCFFLIWSRSGHGCMWARVCSSPRAKPRGSRRSSVFLKGRGWGCMWARLVPLFGESPRSGLSAKTLRLAYMQPHTPHAQHTTHHTTHMNTYTHARHPALPHTAAAVALLHRPAPAVPRHFPYNGGPAPPIQHSR
jgi:hypothetical protein